MRTGPNRRLIGFIGAAALAAGLLAGCGGGSSTPKAPAFDEVAAQTQVTTNFQKFFTSGGTTAEHAALLENGAALTAAIDAQSKNPLAKSAKTTVTKVVILPTHTTATVTYNIAINGNNVITDGTGEAVLQDGKWKVSKTTFCSLANAGSSTGKVPGCV
jgi:hypothetical protein